MLTNECVKVHHKTHACRESVAMGESLTSHIRNHLNPADLATKVIPGGKKRDNTVGLVLYFLGDSIDDSLAPAA